MASSAWAQTMHAYIDLQLGVPCYRVLAMETERTQTASRSGP